MKIDHLNSFRKIAQTGSFTRAAQELFVTQPTITNHIQALENELGCALFIRSNQNTRLTAEGEELAQRVEELFLQLEHIKDIGKPKESIRGELAVAASSVMGTYFLPPVLKTIAEKHDSVNIHMHFGNAYRIATWVQDGFIDAGFAPWVPGFASVSFHRVRTEPCVIVASAAYFERNEKRLCTGDFSRDLFILREKGTQIHNISSDWIRKYPGLVNSRRPLICCDMESIKNLVLCDAGISILPRCVVKDHLLSGSMREIAPSLPMPPVEYFFLHRKHEPHKPLISLLIEELLQQYQLVDFHEERN